MKNYFTKKVVWITGASSGIGRALAIALAAKGARLILSARNHDELKKTNSLCSPPIEGNICLLPLDVSKSDTLKQKVQEGLQFFERIDILINNAGVGQVSLVKDTQMDVHRRLMEVNYFGTIALTQHLLPHFLQTGTGHIVSTSSVMGYIGTPHRAGYAATKHALHGFFDSLRAELWKENKHIHVTLICPGYVQTNISKYSLTGEGQNWGKMDQFIVSGINPDYCARKIAKAIKNKRREMVIAGLKERSAVYVKRFFPGLFARIVRSIPT